LKTFRNFFAELQRRNVYRVAVAYGVVSWLLIQIATQLFPVFEIPNWGARLVIFALALGFPVALVLAWAYEITPEGIKREDADPGKPIAPHRGRALDFVIIGVLLAVIAVMAFRHFRGGSDNPAAPGVPEKSIAVLPFENRSEEKANAYFTESIQDEILTRLSKIAGLKVISRTSTQHYQSAPENLSDIARELGVAHILEGSVQKRGDAVRINVQLIKAITDSPVWAETFDRKLTDVFSVESEVAKAIADQLRVKLTGREEKIIQSKPTESPEAYDAYLRGLAFTLKTAPTSENALGAQKHFKEAVRLDPKFALAWALLSTVDARNYLTQSLPPTIALREEARQAAENALTLQPNLGEALLAKGFYHYACLKDYDTAVRYFEEARKLLPNSSQIPESLAYVERRRGQWDRSEAHLIEAERLDPRNVSLLTGYATNYVCLRRFPEALRKLDQVLDITPDDADTLAAKARIAQAEGDLARASSLLAPLRPTAEDSGALEIQVYQAILERHPEQMIARLKEILAAKPDSTLGYMTGELRFWLGWAQEVAGDRTGAQESWQQARAELEHFLTEQPDNYSLLGDLALTNMGLGDKTAALSLAERAIAANPIEKDAVRGPVPIEILARVAARLGDPDRAITTLQKLLSTPYDGAMAVGPPLTPALLRLDPMFDPLRNDPRFQKLAASSNAK
jgi:TolB-like protein/Tfp pilus assembly protein PilF